MDKEYEKKNRIKLQVIQVFPLRFQNALRKIQWEKNQIEEIRIRMNGPVIFAFGDGIYFLTADGLENDLCDAFIITKEELKQMVTYMCKYSLYAYSKDMRQGFFTLKGGIRVGVAGEMVEEEGHIRSMEHISSLNIRIPNMILGCAKNIMPHLYGEEGLYNTLLISPPGNGKTTYLKDMIRIVASDTKIPMKVAVVDERYEIAAAVEGEMQNDLGWNVDVMSGCRKDIAMKLLLRSMSPDVIAVDELGGKKEYQMTEEMTKSGVHMIATIHGNDLQDIKKHKWGHKWMANHIFQRYVCIHKDCNGKRHITIYDENQMEIPLNRPEEKSGWHNA